MSLIVCPNNNIRMPIMMIATKKKFKDSIVLSIIGQILIGNSKTSSIKDIFNYHKLIFESFWSVRYKLVTLHVFSLFQST